MTRIKHAGRGASKKNELLLRSTFPFVNPKSLALQNPSKTVSGHFPKVNEGQVSAKYSDSTLFVGEFARTGLRGKPVRNALLIACCLARWHFVLLSVILVAKILTYTL